MSGWLRAGRFDAVSYYLRDRGLERVWRFAIFLFTCVLGALPLILLASPVGPSTPVARTVAIAAGISAIAVSTVWLPGWPSHTRSLVYNMVCCACIAAGSLSMSYAYAGLMGCVMFAVLGGFLAYFHRLADVLVNAGIAAVCAGIMATRLVLETGDVAVTVSATVTVLALNVGVPFGIYSLVHSLHSDLEESGRDSLTGLLNRRSFYRALRELITRQRSGAAVNVTMIDLDDFKRLNDSHGHATGDRALADVGEVLRRMCSDTAVLGRLGGEEFVVADVHPPTDHAETADAVRASIAALPFDITASLGTCTALLEGHLEDHEPPDTDFVDRMIAAADAAMYRAKRAGGDRVERRSLTAPGRRPGGHD
ncbi:GGDEF domain-containing protein [Mycolicibacterium sp. 018/SC-01/001]|uniref:GGDEF domain-containing protein n=1 Tax=Mycolicibacterium sp. 018/SC-01/001 TaxID=2592069 RepID=UPI0011811357|nr:GGDEF domain-containing protein [Mycolicibacterium sp. 018/SC-01/001]TRW84908.1 GGDEF domain-containing protein [Mycolicibacterium sp. 018/SC-01/001]